MPDPDDRNLSLDLGDINRPTRNVKGDIMSGSASTNHPDDVKNLLNGEDDLEKLFTYQSPTPDMQEHFSSVSAACLAAARVIVKHCPPSADRTLALQHLVDARMRANASIALRGARLIPMG